MISNSRGKGFWELFNDVLVLSNVHDRNTRDLSDSGLQTLIASCNNEATMLHHTFNQAVICISALVHARKTLETGIAGNLQGKSVLWAEFFQFSNDAVSDANDAFGIQAVHHGLHDIELIWNGKVDKVGIDENLIWGCQSRVVSEKERWCHLFTI